MNDREQNEQIEYIVSVNDILDGCKDEYPINKKLEIFFKNVIVSFQKKCDPITNFLNRKEGALLPLSSIVDSDENGISEDEEGNLIVNPEVFEYNKAYCPICGSPLKIPFNFIEFYSKNENDSNYFKKKEIRLQNEELLDSDNPPIIQFLYLSCDNCCESIRMNYNKYGKPLKNSYLYLLYQKMSTYLGLEIDKEMNEASKSRIIYPTDRMYFRSKANQDSIFYFNLFNLTDYGIYKFEEYFKSLGKTEEEISNGRMIVFTEKSINLFDDTKMSEYRDFEKWLKTEIEKDLNSYDFHLMQLKDFKYELESKEDFEQGINIRVKCTKECENCSKILTIPNKTILYISIPERKSFETCTVKIFQTKDNEVKNEEKEIELKNNEVEEIPIEVENESTESLSDEKITERFNEIEEQITNEINTSCDDNTEEDSNKEEIQLENTNSEEIENNEPIFDETLPTYSPPLNIDTEIVNNDIEKIDFADEDEDNEIEIEIGNHENHIDLNINEETINNDGKIDCINEDDEDDNEDIVLTIEETIEQENKHLLDDIEEKKNSVSIRQALLSTFPPQENDLIRVESILSNTSSDMNLKNSKEKFNLILNKYVDIIAEEMYSIVQQEGISILNKYPLIDYYKLKELVYDIKIEREKFQILEQNKNASKAAEKSSVQLVSERYNPNDEIEPDDHNKYLAKITEKQKKSELKVKDKCDSKFVFRTRDVKQSVPFVIHRTLQNEFERSVFKVIFENVLKMEGYKAGNPVITIEQAANFEIIVDFPDVGVRFVCINTEDTRYKTFIYNPTLLSRKIRFPNEKFKTNYSLNFLYSNECITQPEPVTWAIFKIVNRNFYEKQYTVNLSSCSYPIAYSTESIPLSEVESNYSIFKGIGRVKDGGITLCVFDEESDPNSDFAKRQKLAEKAAKGFLTRSDAIHELLERFNCYYVLSIHYTKDQEWQLAEGYTCRCGATTQGYPDSQKICPNCNTYLQPGQIKIPYISYVITQYTEINHCLIEDGLPIMIMALMKEHYKLCMKDQTNYSYRIIFEYDPTALVTPAVRSVIQNGLRNGILAYDEASLGQRMEDVNQAWVISDPRFKKNIDGLFDDRARIDRRFFEVSTNTFRQVLGNKIRPDEDVRNKESVLMKVGYESYAEPRPWRYVVTEYGLDLLERNPIFNALFEIEINKINQENDFDNISNTITEMLSAQYLLRNNQNIDPNIMRLFDSGSRILNSITNMFKSANSDKNNL